MGFAKTNCLMASRVSLLQPWPVQRLLKTDSQKKRCQPFASAVSYVDVIAAIHISNYKLYLLYMTRFLHLVQICHRISTLTFPHLTRDALQAAAEAKRKEEERLALVRAAKASGVPVGRFPHPGSFTACGGNPDGFANCTGDGK